jgi:pimeloyl-ACP methyl ester carboxylesterase
LIITGDSDVIVPTRASIENANKVPEVSELVVMKNTGHLPHEENPVEFVSHVLAFLRGNP